MKFTLLILATLLSAQFAQALLVGQETREAWVRKAQFDGQIYSYEIVAYENAGDFKSDTSVKCNFGYFEEQKILKSVDFKVFISGNFREGDVESSRTGKIDVGAAIQGCLKSDKEVNQKLESPVALNFPKISVSSKLGVAVP